MRPGIQLPSKRIDDDEESAKPSADAVSPSPA